MVGHHTRVRDQMYLTRKKLQKKQEKKTTDFGKTILYVCVLLL